MHRTKYGLHLPQTQRHGERKENEKLRDREAGGKENSYIDSLFFSVVLSFFFQRYSLPKSLNNLDRTVICIHT